MSTNKNSSNIDMLNSEELRIPVPWGYIAAKWWGSKYVRPVLCIHGWQDNAGSFDRLIPLLPQHVGYLAIDLPGHGLSSQLPPGIIYDKMMFVYVIKLLQHQYKWDKISIIAHSMGAVLGFIYTALFPINVDMMIAIDGLKMFYLPSNKYPDVKKNLLDMHLTHEERVNTSQEPPSYFYNELIDKLYDGMRGSIDKEQSHFLLQRGVKKSELYPDKYYFSRDSRTKYLDTLSYNDDVSYALAKQIKSPYMLLVCSETKKIQVDTKNNSLNFVQFMMETLPLFEFQLVEGRHHTHLNEPEKMSGIITNFINNHRPVNSKSSNEYTSKL